MYRFNNQHDSAIIIYADYLAQKKYRNLEFEQRALQEQEACKWVLEQRKDTTSKPYIYNITHVGKQINTKMNESGAMKIDSLILFTRTTHISKAESKNSLFSEYILTQIYQSRYLKNGKLTKSVLNEWGFNDTRMHSGNIAYDPDSQTIYFTLCDAEYSGNGNMCEIYMSEYLSKPYKSEV